MPALEPNAEPDVRAIIKFGFTIVVKATSDVAQTYINVCLLQDVIADPNREVLILFKITKTKYFRREPRVAADTNAIQILEGIFQITTNS